MEHHPPPNKKQEGGVFPFLHSTPPCKSIFSHYFYNLKGTDSVKFEFDNN